MRKPHLAGVGRAADAALQALDHADARIKEQRQNPADAARRQRQRIHAVAEEADAAADSQAHE